MASQFTSSAPFGVNAIATGSQDAPSVLVFESGRYLVAWEDTNEAPGNTRYLNARFYNQDGSPSGAVFRLNALAAHPQSDMALSRLAGGGFVAVWSGRSSADNPDYDIRARLFDEAGNPLGAEFTVNPGLTANVQQDPSVTLLANGNFVVTWTNWSGVDGVGPDLQSASVMARIFTPAGTPVGSEFLINPNPEGAQQDSKVVALAGGGFAVVWTDSSGLYGDPDTAIVAQLFSDEGVPAGPALLVNTATGNSQLSPAVAALPDGGFVVAWEDDSGVGDPSALGIKAQLFDGNGGRTGGEILVNSSTPDFQFAPAVTALAQGGFLIAWGDFASRPSGAEVFGQYFDDSGNKVGAEVSLTGGTARTQEQPALGAFPDGSFVLAYTDSADPPGPSFLDEESVSARQFTIQRSGVSLVGTAAANSIHGGPNGDFIDGRGGFDELHGEAGDDLLRGGDGSDMLVAGAGSDRLFGGIGQDYLHARGGGQDWLFGDAGTDTLVVEIADADPISTAVMQGGSGDDRLTFISSRFTDSARMIGGYGNDQFTIYRGGEVTVDAGPGADLVELSILGGTYRITLGSGRDLLTPHSGGPVAGGSILVTDFETGASGDRLELGEYLPNWAQDWDLSTNPFATGHLRLVQDGGDAVLQADRDGAGGFYGFVEFIRFAGTSVGAFTQGNLGGYPGDGSAAVPVGLEGTAAAETLRGDGGDDSIRGLGGDDRIYGGVGDDRLEGGDGHDFLIGDYGDNLLLGGEGDDHLVGPGNGNDRMFGEAGNDYINVARMALGGEDLSLLLDGGTGDDTIYFFATGRYRDSVTINGGSGREDIMVDGGKAIVIDAGEDADSIRIDFVGETYRLTLGAGADRVTVDGHSWGTVNRPTFTFTDFAAGAAGAETDQLFLRTYLASVLPGWDGTSDPFAPGFLRLVQTGPDAVLLIDSDGSAGGGEAVELLRFLSLDATALTAHNLNGLKAPAVHGTGGNDVIAGSAADDRLEGGDGNDDLRSGAGTDSLHGGAGNDALYFGSSFGAGDLADGGPGRDALVLQGNVAVVLTDASIAGIESISLQSGATTKFGDTANNRYDFSVTTADGNVSAGQQLIVNGQSLLAGEDLTFDGSAETDGKFLIYAGHGTDVLKGGAGVDVFFFEGDRWGPDDRVDGGAGRDAVVISGGTGLKQVTFGANSLTNVESISVNATLASDPSAKPSYAFVLHNGNVTAGGNLIVNGNSLVDPTQTLSVDGSAVQDGTLTMYGGAGNDAFKGGAGADLLYGGLGKDTLTGNAGADLFQFRSASESSVANPDAVLDFQAGVDRIHLVNMDANSTVAGDQAFTFIGANAFDGTAGQLRAYESGGTWFVEGDTDGNGAADFAIAVTSQGGTPLGQGDFLL
jgi:Ca2+-binding RTX toxin-like protein